MWIRLAYHFLFLRLRKGFQFSRQREIDNVQILAICMIILFWKIFFGIKMNIFIYILAPVYN